MLHSNLLYDKIDLITDNITSTIIDKDIEGKWLFNNLNVSKSDKEKLEENKKYILGCLDGDAPHPLKIIEDPIVIKIRLKQIISDILNNKKPIPTNCIFED